ncbi:MAG TPA: hypothetical protein ENG51_19590 [Deltaproteobacteria bacterium]|nr:hypothetical protein [Deltaproteobacteria bacterium]
MPVTIEKTNKKTGEVSRKVYETVAERVRKFREVHPISDGWALKTEISFPDESTVLAVAQVLNPEGSIVATGTAEERRDASFINATSAVENAETSAIGRCLFAAGFGGGEFCSAEELLQALKQQEELKQAELKVVNGGQDKESHRSNGDDSLGPKLNGITYRQEGNLIIAEGNTFSVKGLLKNAGFSWNSTKKAWAKEIGNTEK